jgi:hypothetical protein
MEISSIRCELSLFGFEKEKTVCSLVARIFAISLGGITLMIGVLALSGIPELHALNTLSGAALTTIGGLSFFAGACLRCVKKNSEPSTQTESTSTSEELSKKEIAADVLEAIDFLDNYQKPKFSSDSEEMYYWFSKEGGKVGGSRHKVGQEILTIFKEKWKQKSAPPLEFFCRFNGSTVEFDMIFPPRGKLECRGCFRGEEGFIRSKSGHYPNHNYISLCLRWPGNEGPFAERVEMIWKQFNRGLQWWKRMQKKIEKTCFEGDVCTMIPSNAITEADLFFEGVTITVDQEDVSCLFYADMEVKLEESEDSLELRGGGFRLKDNCDLIAEFQLELKKRLIELFEEEVEMRKGMWQGGLPDFSKFFSLGRQEQEPSAPENIKNLDVRFELDGELISAYNAKDKAKGLKLIRGIKQKFFKIHPDQAVRNSMDAAVQTEEFQEINKLMASATAFFQSIK